MLSKKLFVLSAPAGTGKTTLMKLLMDEFPDICASVSFTTRAKRGDEKEGVDYHFITKEEFEKKIAAGEFLEYVQLYNDYYGTSKKWVEQKQKAGKKVFLVIDTQGALKVLGQIPAVFIFVMPPSLQVLEKRLRARNTDSEEAIQKRLNWAKEEMRQADKYDYRIVNDELKEAYKALRDVITAESHKI